MSKGVFEFSNLKILLMILFCILISIGFMVTASTMATVKKQLDYCYMHGWVGITGNIPNTVCFKNVLHESGTGNNVIYSGTIPMEVYSPTTMDEIGEMGYKILINDYEDE